MLPSAAFAAITLWRITTINGLLKNCSNTPYTVSPPTRDVSGRSRHLFCLAAAETRACAPRNAVGFVKRSAVLFVARDVKRVRIGREGAAASFTELFGPSRLRSDRRDRGKTSASSETINYRIALLRCPHPPCPICDATGRKTAEFMSTLSGDIRIF